jgi:hypothetical protein
VYATGPGASLTAATPRLRSINKGARTGGGVAGERDDDSLGW